MLENQEKLMKALLFTVLCFGLTPVDAYAAPPKDLPDLGPDGIDPDTSKVLEEAENLLETKELDQAADTLIGLLLGSDRFAKAARPVISERTSRLLQQTADGQIKAGNLAGAARSLDARWILQGRPEDEQYARLLTRWAEKRTDQNKGEALYLARRALLAAPNLSIAADLDAELSNNNRVILGRSLQVASAVAFGVGIWAFTRASSITDEIEGGIHSRAEVDSLSTSRRRHGWLGTLSMIGTPILFYSGVFTITSGNPDYRPVSPAELPALDD